MYTSYISHLALLPPIMPTRRYSPRILHNYTQGKYGTLYKSNYHVHNPLYTHIQYPYHCVPHPQQANPYHKQPKLPCIHSFDCAMVNQGIKKWIHNEQVPPASPYQHTHTYLSPTIPRPTSPCTSPWYHRWTPWSLEQPSGTHRTDYQMLVAARKSWGRQIISIQKPNTTKQTHLSSVPSHIDILQQHPRIVHTKIFRLLPYYP